MAVTIDGTTGITSPAIDLTTPLAVADGGTARSDNVMSMVRLNARNGYGSTNTKICRWTNTITNQGTDITYADSATLGGSFTVNTDGVYSISFSLGNPATSGWLGVSLNTTAPTTSIYLIPASEILTATYSVTSNGGGSVGWVGYLSSGSIVRAHTEGIGAATYAAIDQFTITRVR